MNRLCDVASLAPDDWDNWNLEQSRLSRFEDWRGANPAAGTRYLNEFLPPPGDARRPPSLLELIKTDLEIRWRNGQPALLEGYAVEFPELGSPRELPLALIYEEYRVRLLFGDRPAPESYRERFPGRFEAFHQELARRIQEGSLARRTPVPQNSGPSASVVSVGPGSVVGKGQYTLQEKLGEGAYGAVFAAVNERGRPFAVKIISSSEEETERKAVEEVKGIPRHTYLLHAIDYMWENGLLLIIMELAGGTLDGLRKRTVEETGKGLRVDLLLGYMTEAAEALDYLHGRGIIHRDVKPANILVMEDGHVRVADFGLAKALPESASSMMASQALGTPAYMAPETFRGKSVHAPGDLFSLAASYVHLRLGHLPKEADSNDQWLAVLGKEPNLNALPPAERKVLLKALSIDPRARHDSCGELVAELRKAVERKSGLLPRVADWVLGGSKEPSSKPNVRSGAVRTPRPKAPSSDGGSVGGLVAEGNSTRQFPSGGTPGEIPAAKVKAGPYETPQKSSFGTMMSLKDEAVATPSAGKDSLEGFDSEFEVEPWKKKKTANTRQTRGRTVTHKAKETMRPPEPPKSRRWVLVLALLAVGGVVVGGWQYREELTRIMTALSGRGDDPAKKDTDEKDGSTDVPGTLSPVPNSLPVNSLKLPKEPDSATSATAPKPPLMPTPPIPRDPAAEARREILDALKAIDTETNDPADAVEALVKVFENEAAPLAFADQDLRRKALASFSEVFRKTRQGGKWDDPFEGQANTEKVYRWLSAAARHVKDGDDEAFLLMTQLVIAASHVKPPLPPDQIRNYARTVLTPDAHLPPLSEKLGTDALPFFLAAARANSAPPGDDPVLAIRSYAEVVRLLGNAGTLGSEDLYIQVLAPALLTAERLPPGERNKDLARINARLGKLLAREIHRSWVGKVGGDPERRIFGAYDTAIRLDPDEPTYYIERGYVTIRLRPNEWASVEEDARGAEKARGQEFHASLGLRAYVKLMAARKEIDPPRKELLLRESVRKYERAAGQMRGDPEARDYHYALLTGLATSHVELANRVAAANNEEGRKHLGLALKVAEEVIGGTASELERAYALSAKGNALEDFAWVLGDDRDTNYKNAVAAFQKASETLDLPFFAMCRGRCLTKWSLVPTPQDRGGKTKSQRARDAVKVLSLAAPLLATSREQAEAYFWLGNAHIVLNQLELAEEPLRKAADLAAKDSLSSRGPYKLAQAEFELARATAALAKDRNDARGLQLLAQARRHAGECQPAFPLEAALIVARSHDARKEWRESLDAYDTPLRNKSLEDIDSPKYLPLIMGRLQCWMSLDAPDTYERMCDSARNTMKLADRLIAEDNVARAHAYRAAGDAFRHVAIKNHNTKNRKEAVEAYEKAIGLDSGYKYLFSTHRETAIQCLNLYGEASDQRDRDAYNRKARHHVERAYKIAKDDNERDSLTPLDELLNKLPRPE